MRKFIPIAFILLFSCAVSAQEKTLTDYDLCKEDVSKSAIRKYEKALSFYKSKNYQKSSQILQQLIKEEEDFASPCFLMGMIGVVKDNTAMIMKYFPMVQQRCPQFDHPYQYYYMGMIDYTEERYEKAVQNFETFLSVTEGNNFYDSLQNVAINYIDWSEFLHNTIENKVDFNPKKINFLAENKNYAEPFITWDKQQIYFIREHITRTSDKGGFISDVQTSSKRLLNVSELDSTGFYDKGFEAQDPFNNLLPQSGVSMTADNNFVFFAAKNNADKSDNTWNIYRCERVGDYFSQATPVNINTTL
ncbi:MAG: hypothetical protein IJ250_07095, partial [Bacteroidales bacterium]|nr:hypothetical protein [Bacteroidales bacterium]